MSEMGADGAEAAANGVHDLWAVRVLAELHDGASRVTIVMASTRSQNALAVPARAVTSGGDHASVLHGRQDDVGRHGQAIGAQRAVERTYRHPALDRNLAPAGVDRPDAVEPVNDHEAAIGDAEWSHRMSPARRANAMSGAPRPPDDVDQIIARPRVVGNGRGAGLRSRPVSPWLVPVKSEGRRNGV